MPRTHKDTDKQKALRHQGTLNPRPQDVRHPLFRDSDFFDPDDMIQVKYEMLRHVIAGHSRLGIGARISQGGPLSRASKGDCLYGGHHNAHEMGGFWRSRGIVPGTALGSGGAHDSG